MAAATGRLAAAQGRKTVVVEVDNQHPSLTAIFGVEPTHQPREVAKNLSIANVMWESSLDDWLADVVSVPRVLRMITRNKVVTVFLDATPGARDLVVLWRLYQLTRQYDLVVVDMPASGNATGMLSVITTSLQLFDAGPIRRCAEDLHAMLSQAGTRLVLVGLPEEMVVNETIETWKKVRAEFPHLQMPMVVLNRATSPSLEAGEQALIAALQALPAEGPMAVEVLEAGRWEAGLETATAAAQARLAEELQAPVLALPVMPKAEAPARRVIQLTSALARASSIPVDWVEGRA